ncbi:MAG: FkbM family methyltransferase [Bacteroidales bacterium]|nr:FkbM family methyltransferase [Bacteroidales bacterium]
MIELRLLFYKVIYTPKINYVLRNINKIISKILPGVPKLPPSGIIHLQLDRGILKIKTNQTNYLTHLVFWEGFSNFEYTELFLDLIKNINTFYDIGANIGYYSLLASVQNPAIQVYSFEPATGPLYYLRENIQLNKLQNINVEPIALSHIIEGQIEFYEIHNKKYSYLQYNLAGEGNAGSQISGRNFVVNKVPTTTLDHYYTSHSENPVDLIKMDTEGTEHLILEHASLILGKIKPIIICETLYNTIEMDLERLLLNYHYNFYNHVPGGLMKVETLIRTVDNGVRNCFFVHPDRFHLIEKYIIKN